MKSKHLITITLLLTHSLAAAAETRQRSGVERVLTKNNEPVGYRIRYLGDNSELEKAGIQPGDILQNVCGIKLIDIQAYVKADQALMRGEKECLIVFLRQGERQTVRLESKQ
jgi:type II secretory pathway component PulC